MCILYKILLIFVVNSKIEKDIPYYINHYLSKCVQSIC